MKTDAGMAAKMLLMHDIVEIDAGDTYCYDDKGSLSKKMRENLAAERIFGLLPEDQAEDFRKIWDEFEARKTPEAKFAAAIDRIIPVLHNFHTEGKSWKEHNITLAQVMDRIACIRDISEKLWRMAKSVAEEAVSKGYLGK